MISVSKSTRERSTLEKTPVHRSSRHHRRPRRHGGETDRHNIQKLPMRSHAAWHRLFNHLYATNIAKQINVWKDFHGITVGCKRSENPQYADKAHLVCGEHIQTEMTAKQHEAWDYLFEGLSAAEIVYEINTLYLDLDYRFFIRRR